MNVSLFEKAGLLNSDGLPQAPDNWDEFKETAAKLTDPSNGVWGTMLRDYGGQEDTVNFFHVFLTMAGGKFVDDNYEKFLFNSPEGLDALNFQVNLIKEGMMMSPGAPSENIIENNKIGIWWHAANYWPGLLENNPDLQWSTSINPMRKTRGAVIRANHLVIFKEAAHTEAAWKFMEFHMRPDTDYLYAQNANYITAVKENHSKPYYEGNYEGRKGVTFATEFEQLAIAENQPQPTFPGYQESTFKIGAQLMEAYLQQKSPEEALTQAELEGNEVLASARRMLGIGASQ
jgi:ABC-type glycerol-3-phosphate transport system substrate-binding protein